MPHQRTALGGKKSANLTHMQLDKQIATEMEKFYKREGLKISCYNQNVHAVCSSDYPAVANDGTSTDMHMVCPRYIQLYAALPRPWVWRGLYASNDSPWHWSNSALHRRRRRRWFAEKPRNGCNQRTNAVLWVQTMAWEFVTTGFKIRLNSRILRNF